MSLKAAGRWSIVVSTRTPRDQRDSCSTRRRDAHEAVGGEGLRDAEDRERGDREPTLVISFSSFGRPPAADDPRRRNASGHVSMLVGQLNAEGSPVLLDGLLRVIFGPGIAVRRVEEIVDAGGRLDVPGDAPAYGQIAKYKIADRRA